MVQCIMYLIGFFAKYCLLSNVKSSSWENTHNVNCTVSPTLERELSGAKHTHVVPAEGQGGQTGRQSGSATSAVPGGAREGRSGSHQGVQLWGSVRSSRVLQSGWDSVLFYSGNFARKLKREQCRWCCLLWNVRYPCDPVQADCIRTPCVRRTPFTKITGIFKRKGCSLAFSYSVATKMNRLVIICTCTTVCVK